MTEQPKPSPTRPANETRPATAACARVSSVINAPARRHSASSGRRAQAAAVATRPVISPARPPERGFAAAAALFSARRRREGSESLEPLDPGQLFPSCLDDSQQQRQRLHGTQVKDGGDALVAHLRERVDTLSALLEEERRRRREEMAALAEEARAALERQARAQEAELEGLTTNQREAIARLQRRNAELTTQAQLRHKKARRQLETRIEYLKAGFETFKAAHTLQVEERWSAREATLVSQSEAAALRMAEAASIQVARELEAEAQSLREAHAEATRRLLLRQQAELAEAREAHAADEATLQRLAAASNELTAKEAGIQSMRQQLESSSREVREARGRLALAEAELAAETATEATGRALDERLAAAETEWQRRLESQRMETDQLRLAYEEKCRELPILQQQQQQQQQERRFSGPTTLAERATASALDRLALV